ncbi:hypothetical protein F0562_030331 [Nyssa sinensis]|uniref:Uncharacterized protein n=1 Tax=Nyssa sinensis TaxID=561372 RepID=A0A5J5AYK1_9ASTE|nr:hypothetical protein F0562_030331 [Nyssa sinensis]
MIGVGKIKQYTNVLDKPLSRGKQEVSLKRRLEDARYAVGAWVLELLCHRDKVADSLEKGTEHEDEYMISEKELLVNRNSKGFPAVVTAHFVPVEGQQRPRTIILIKFAEEVLEREARLS